jgi:hypothetical protein
MLYFTENIRSTSDELYHSSEQARQPDCEKPIHISVGRWPGGTNDSGG